MKKDGQLNRTESDICRYMLKHKEFVTSKEIADSINTTQSNVSIHLKVLWEHDILQREKNEDKSFSPFINRGWKYIICVDEKALKLGPGLTRESYDILTAEDLEGLLNKWSTEKWEPKIFKSACNLPYALAKIYALSVEIMYGAAVENSDLLEVKQHLQDFQTDLKNTLSVVEKVLKTRSLWDSDELAGFLIKSEDIDRYQNIAKKVRDLNGR